MEKINRPTLDDIVELKSLKDNWEKWGLDYHTYIQGGKKTGTGKVWSWKSIYTILRESLESLTDGHCSFCDGYPIGENSKETIEHFKPKGQFPKFSYQWENLFYCCDKCQSDANKHTFQYTLKSDEPDYSFDRYFYFDLESGKLNILENLEQDSPNEFNKALEFLKRYGINNNPKRNLARKHTFRDVMNWINNPDDRIRNDFKYRYVFDFASRLT